MWPERPSSKRYDLGNKIGCVFKGSEMWGEVDIIERTQAAIIDVVKDVCKLCLSTVMPLKGNVRNPAILSARRLTTPEAVALLPRPSVRSDCHPKRWLAPVRTARDCQVVELVVGSQSTWRAIAKSW